MYNYHTHTYRCGHAIGLDEEYVQEAIKSSYKGIGFSDHIMLPKLEEVLIRAHYKEINDYFSSINSLKEKYKKEIEIYTSFECEWDNNYEKFYRKLLQDNKVDYLIFGNHNCYFKGKKEHFLKYISKKNYLRRYVNKSIKALRSGLFKIMAHPDIFMSGLKWDKDCEKVAKIICKEAKINNVALELNCGCFINEKKKNICGEERYRYPFKQFWDIAKKEGNLIVVGIDAHAPSAFSSPNINLMNQFIEKNHIKVEKQINF